jgi:hypothetical protein
MKKYLLLCIVLTLSTNQVFAYNFSFGESFAKILKQITADNDYETAEKSYSIFNPQTEPTTPISEIIRTFNTPQTQSTPVRVTSQNIQKETALQRLLSGLGVSKNEVKQFQKDNGLKADGIVGPKTTAKINEEIEKINDTGFEEEQSIPKTTEDSSKKDDTKTISNTSTNLKCTNNGCLGLGRATTFNHSTVACAPFKANPNTECYGALSLQSARDLCKGKNQKCYCNEIAKVTVNGKTLNVPIKDVGAKVSSAIEFAPGVVLDITPGCVQKSGFGSSVCRGGGENTSCYGLQVSLQPKTQVAELK